MRRLILGFIVLISSTFAAPAAAQPTDYVRTYFLTHVAAMEMQQALAPLFQGAQGHRPSITMTRTNNTLTIRDTEATLRTAEEIIKQLDVPAGTQGQSTAARSRW